MFSYIWTVLQENVLMSVIVTTVFNYLTTMRKLIENTIKDDLRLSFHSQYLILPITALSGIFSLFIGFYCIHLFLQFVRWLIFGRNYKRQSLRERNSLINSEYSNLQENGIKQQRSVRMISESRRWVKQALCDLESARNDFDDINNPAPEWVCFKCQQALEKALKAYLMYTQPSISDKITRTHDLCDLAMLSKDSELISVCMDVQGRIGLSSRMRYPDFLPFPKIPRDVYSLQDAITVHALSQRAVQYIDQHMPTLES